jgi:phosphohistidine phosphatase SixA
MTILLIRHASAGKRKDWRGDDRLRPLDVQGRRQAEGLVELLRERAPSRVLSSAYARCRQTVEPLARALGLAVERRHELEEGASADDIRGLGAEVAGEVVVFCTHGDVVEAVLGSESEKGSTWVLGLDGGKLKRIEYLPPPA